MSKIDMDSFERLSLQTNLKELQDDNKVLEMENMVLKKKHEDLLIALEALLNKYYEE